MGIVDRILQTGLPLDQLIVSGGVLDVLGLRTADDLDMVVSAELFERLVADVSYVATIRHGDTVITKGDQEIWLYWGGDGQPNFDSLYAGGFSVSGVRFADVRTVIEWKRVRATPKDIGDIELLNSYLNTKVIQ